MNTLCNVIKVGATRKGKTLSAARDVVESDGAELDLDPHKESLADSILIHAEGNILHARLSDLEHTFGFDLLVPSAHPDPRMRSLENQRRAEAFVEVLLRRRSLEGMGSTPLMDEWIYALITLYLFQKVRRHLTDLPFGFLPGTEEFEGLVRGCELADIRAKFRHLEKLTPRALRAEVGSAVRLVNGVFRSPAFAVWSRGGFDLGRFLQNKGKLIVERGDEIGDDTMRILMGAIVLLVIDHAKRRPEPYPPIHIRIDEATNAGLVGRPELKGIAETNKNGLYWDFYVQNLDFPGGADAVLQNCHRHEWFGCPFYDLARKAATDVAAGLKLGDEETRASKIAALTTEIMNLPPGWRWVRDPSGSRKEYVPLLENPWVDWPGLREAKLREKLWQIHARPEYGGTDTPPDSTSSNDIPPPPPSSPSDSSAAQRWRRGGGRRAGGSSSSGGESGSA